VIAEGWASGPELDEPEPYQPEPYQADLEEPSGPLDRQRDRRTRGALIGALALTLIALIGGIALFAFHGKAQPDLSSAASASHTPAAKPAPVGTQPTSTDVSATEASAGAATGAATAAAVAPSGPSAAQVAAAQAAAAAAQAAAARTATMKAEAKELDALLTQSASTRAGVQAAIVDAGGCGSSTAQDADALVSAATARNDLVTQLQGLALTDLPHSAALESDLTQAWQAAAASDMSYSEWAQDISDNGCGVGQDSSYQAAQVTDQTATAQKKAFLALWNPIASRFHLKSRMSTDL
jgi:hypothetical protein